MVILLVANVLWITAPSLRAQPAPPTPAILFIGNSFTFAAGSPVRFYRASTVTDLNNEGIGGVPALFKAFTTQAGRDFNVSLETSGGKNFDWHLANKSAVLAKPWDYVVMHGYSTLDQKNPGDPALLVKSGKELAALLIKENPKVDIRLLATWSRADQTYPEKGHWHGHPIEKMAIDVRSGYDLAAAAIGPSCHSVIPVGQAWNRAMKSNIADPNPYDGISPNQIDLWTHDHYHASAYGYYLSALMIFGDITGLDPRSLGKSERTAMELGFSPAQAEALQRVAYDELATAKGRPPLQAFKPAPLKSSR
jgi:hypothetical protein